MENAKLRRSLTVFPLVLFGLAYMAPTTSFFYLWGCCGNNERDGTCCLYHSFGWYVVYSL